MFHGPLELCITHVGIDYVSGWCERSLKQDIAIRYKSYNISAEESNIILIVIGNNMFHGPLVCCA